MHPRADALIVRPAARRMVPPAEGVLADMLPEGPNALDNALVTLLEGLEN